jgi:hypothetical protein
VRRMNRARTITLKIAILGTFAFPVMALASPFTEQSRLEDIQLEALRGGFTLPSGASVAVGIDIETTVNGQLALRTQYSSEDATSGTDALSGMRVTAGDSGSVSLARDGGNTTVSFSADSLLVKHVLGSAASSIVANTANDRSIDTTYSINVELSEPWAATNALSFVDRVVLDALTRR